MLGQVKKVKYAVLNAPYLLPLYMRKPYNPLITKTTLDKMLNRSCGIEIECFGSLRYMFAKNNMINSHLYEFDKIESYYNIMAYHEDNPYIAYNNIHDEYNEHKIRIKDHTQLTGLYEILSDMKKYCELNTGSGIHIHVDATDIYNACEKYLHTDAISLIAKYLEPRLGEIEQIFYPGGKYTGKYNDCKSITTWKNHSWVSAREGMGTIEFRIAPMTFEYTDIARWCVELCQLVNKMVLSYNKLNKLCNVRCKEKPITIKQEKRIDFSELDRDMEEFEVDEDCEVDLSEHSRREDVVAMALESYSVQTIDVNMLASSSPNIRVIDRIQL